MVAIFCGQLIQDKKVTLYGNGEMIRDYVFVSDIVNANIKAMDGGDGEIYNIGTGKSTSVRELFGILKDISGSNIEPDFKEAREGEIQEISLNPTKASQELGWVPAVTLEEGLSLTYGWFKKHFR